MEFLEYIDYIMGPSDFLILISSAAAMGALDPVHQETRMGKAMGDGPEPQDGHAARWHQYGQNHQSDLIIGSALGALGGVLIASHMGCALSISALVLLPA